MEDRKPTPRIPRPRKMHGRTALTIERAMAMQEQAAASRAAAIAMKDGAANVRLRIWLERLAETPRLNNRQDTLEIALEAALSVACADCGNIQWLDDDGRRLVLVAHRGFSPSFTDYFQAVDDQTTASGVAWKENRAISVEDSSHDPTFDHTEGQDVLLADGIRCVQSVPLVTRSGRMLGMLSVHFRRTRTHHDADLERFHTLADAVANLIEGS